VTKESSWVCGVLFSGLFDVGLMISLMLADMVLYEQLGTRDRNSLNSKSPLFWQKIIINLNSISTTSKRLPGMSSLDVPHWPRQMICEHRTQEKS
jgi:hypothetical protein